MDQGVKSYWAEFLGTFTLCFIGQGAICASQMTGSGDLLAIAVAHGLALCVMVTALGATSGGHFNPAVTFGFLVTGRQSIASAVAYWISQLLGAVVASYLLVFLLPEPVWRSVDLGSPGVNPAITPMAAMIIELIATFFLVTVVWGSAVDERAPKVGGFAIGLTVSMGILFAGPFTGAALNPARALGAMIASGSLANMWVWTIGPMAGGAIAALIYKQLVMRPR